MWDCEGLECLFNVEDHARREMKRRLAGQPPGQGINLMAMTLRARYNSQRHYEIYGFTVDEGVDEDSIRDWFQRDPQSIVDWIRKNGQKLYSDRFSPTRVKIA